MEFREYKKEDSEDVNKIFSIHWNDQEFLDELKRELSSTETDFYVAEQDGEIAGVASTRKVPKYLRGEADKDGVIELYIIASKEKNGGVGSFLMENVTREVQKRGFSEIVCYSPETHKSSWKFYEKNGFTQHGIINDPEDGYPGMLWKKSV